MNSHPASALFSVCMSILMGLILLSATAQQPPGAATRQAVQAHTEMEITNFAFRIEGTPFLARIQEIAGIVYPEDLDSKQNVGARSRELLPGVEVPASTPESGTPFLPSSLPRSESRLTFLTRPQVDRRLELQLLLKLKGIRLDPTSAFAFVNPEKGTLYLRGTPRDADLVRELIQNPPTNALTYLKSLSIPGIAEKVKN